MLSNNKELFVYDHFAPVVKESDGRRYSDDRLIVRFRGAERPVFSCRSVPKDRLGDLALAVLY